MASEGPRATVLGASEIAGDRPPRYGIGCILAREGQALALRCRGPCIETRRSRLPGLGVQEMPDYVI